MDETPLFIGATFPKWILDEGFEPLGEVRTPKTGEWFWSPIIGDAVRAIDESGGARLILKKVEKRDHRSEVQPVRADVSKDGSLLRFPVQEHPGDSPGLPAVPAVEPEEGGADEPGTKD